MRFLIVHLSDLHFDAEGDNAAIYRAGNIVQAALGNVLGVDRVLVVATGDFVNRGDTRAYELATIFFEDLKQSVEAYNSEIRFEGVVLLPGNHDMERPADPTVRYSWEKALADLQKRGSTLDPESIQVSICLERQKAYFGFARKVTGRVLSTNQSRLCDLYMYPLGDLMLTVVALNTSWMCHGDQDQGRLLAWMPPLTEANDPSTLHLMAMHHPYSWLVRENAKPIEKAVAHYADLVLSGHEHESDDFVRHHQGAQTNAFFEGDALSGPKGGFAAIAIDTNTGSRKTYPFVWNGEAYMPIDERPWVPLRRGIGGPSDGLFYTDAFEEFLEDAGMPTSRSGQRISLDEVFVYPRLRDITLEIRTSQPSVDRRSSIDGGSGQYSRPQVDSGKPVSALDVVLNAGDILKSFNTSQRVLLVGDTRSGKSTLLKKYCQELRSLGLAPLFLKPCDCQDPAEDAILSAAKRRIAEQYGPENVQRYLQAPPSKRVLLIDELQSTTLSSTQLSSLLNSLASFAEHSILAGDELYVLRQIWATFENASLLKYKVYRLLEFDPRQRKELGAKMHAAINAQGSEHDSGEALNWLDQSVNSVLGEHIITPSAGEVKAVIGAFLLQPNGGSTHGAFGFYYDTQIKNDITSGLQSCPKDVLEPQADAIEAFLSQLAMTLHRKKSIYASEQDLDDLIAWFRAEKIVLDKPALKAILKSARLIVEKDEGYCFRERYQRYYFMARSLERMLGSDSSAQTARDILKGFVDTIHERESADVVLFTVYLTNSQWLLKMVADRSDQIFASEPQCDMARDFEFVQASEDQVRALEAQLPEESSEGSGGEVVVDRDHQMEGLLIDTVKTMSEAFNVLTILGLAVRNYPAKIEVGLRTEMVENGYALSLRSLTAFLRLIREGSRELDILAKRHLKMKVGSGGNGLFALQLVSQCSFGIVRRNVQAFASPHLELLLTDVWKDDRRVSARMLRFGTLLDLRKSGQHEAAQLHSDLKDNQTADLILKYVVAYNLRVFRASRDRRLNMCRAVDINPDHPAYYYNPTRPKAIGHDR